MTWNGVGCVLESGDQQCRHCNLFTLMRYVPRCDTRTTLTPFLARVEFLRLPNTADFWDSIWVHHRNLNVFCSHEVFVDVG